MIEWYWVVAIGLTAVAAGAVFGVVLSLNAFQSAAKSEEPFHVFGEWMMAVPVWKLDQDRLWHENSILNSAIRGVRNRLGDLLETCDEDDLVMFRLSPDEADNSDVIAMSCFAQQAKMILDEFGVGAVKKK